jgi:heme-degrading monooxygenase HmoA
MFVVIFEVEPRPDRTDEYLKLAQHLKPMVEAIDGFLEVERFASRRTEGKLLSLSSWRDEQALVRWRIHAEHRRVQTRGRKRVFEDYRLRVGEIVTDSERPSGIRQTPSDGTEIAAAQVVTITELVADPEGISPDAAFSRLGLAPAAAGPIDQETFASIYTPSKLVLLASWRDAPAAQAWRPRSAEGMRHRQVHIIRDYGMFERRQAPQHFRGARPNPLPPL